MTTEFPQILSLRLSFTVLFQNIFIFLSVTGIVAIVDSINGMNVGDSYSINEGYPLVLLCVASESQTEPRWIGPNEREGTTYVVSLSLHYFFIVQCAHIHTLVQDVTEFMNSSFTNIGSRRNLNDGLSVRDFRGLYSFRVSNGSLQGVFLISYINQPDFILPNSSIGGTYTCLSGNNAISVSINVRSMCPLTQQVIIQFFRS